MSQEKNTVIRASAGTGKTFQLSNRFIGLLAAGQPLDGILATTFTRKAAGEILDRVLVRLADAVLDPEKLAELAEHVEGPPLDCGRCLGLLREMLRHLHRLRISTLDSFFIAIAQSFGLELGFPTGWAITEDLDDAAIRDEAVRLLLEKEDTKDVVRLMHLLNKGDATRSVSQQITDLVTKLYAVFCEAPAEAWKSLRRRKLLGADELRGAIEALGVLELAGDKRFQKAVDTDRKTIVGGGEKGWESFLSKGLAAAVLDGTEVYCRKPIPDNALAVYRPLVEHTTAVVLGRIVDRTEATWDLLQRFDAEYQRLKAARRAFRFEDVTRRLSGPAIGDRLEEVGYRLDGHVAHLLLDEFQDTSPQQWRALRPFARRVVAGADRSLFCVGDVKQAIYAWRGGVAEIFDALKDEFPALDERRLDQSFRSSQVVIDCVNRVFAGIANNAVLQRTCKAAAEKWSQRFGEHSTAKDLPGYCRLLTAAAPADNEKQWTATLRFAADEVVRLHGESPESEIGVLVRTNDAVARLIFELRHRKIEASEEGGHPLIDSPAVEVVLSLLALADHPGDTAARYHIAHSPIAGRVGLADDADSPAAWRLAEATRCRLVVEGYGPVVADWAGKLAEFCDRRDVNRLEQLVEMAYGYEDRATIRPSDFVKLVQKKRVQDPTSARVRVMTVHQAKGLEFDIVVLPELDEDLTGQTPAIVTNSPKPAEPIDCVCRYVSEKVRGILPDEFKEMFDKCKERDVEESLCLLYVAMTRARHSLQMIIAPSDAKEKTVPATFAGLLRAALTGGGPVGENQTLYKHGDPQWSVASRRADSSPSFGAPPGGPSLAAAPIWPNRPERPTRGLQHRSPSGLEGGGRVRLARHLRPHRDEALDRGSLSHAWFECIGWLEDGEPTDDELLRIACDKKLDYPDLGELIGRFRESLHKPTVEAALRKATYLQPAGAEEVCRVHASAGVKDPQWHVFRERPFAVADAGGVLQGVFDRLVVLRDGSQIIGADVLDYKTDDVGDDPRATDARVEHYRPQLEAYRAAARMLAIPPAMVSSRLLFVGPGVVRAV
jgi:ATP-dependent helicase/nuclease subunit A